MAHPLKNTPPPIFSSLLAYDSFESEHRVFVNRTTFGTIIEVSPLLFGSEAVEKIFSSFLTDAMPHTLYLDFLMLSLPDIEKDLEKFVKTRSEHANPIYHWLSEKRRDFFRKESLKGFSEIPNFLIKKNRYFISVCGPQKNTSIKEIKSVRDDLIAALHSIPLHASILDPTGLLGITQFLTLPQKMTHSIPTSWDTWNPLHTQMIPDDLSLLIEPDHLWFETNETPIQARAFSVSRFPSEPHLSQMGDTLGAFFNPHLFIPCPFACILQIKPIEKTTALSQATTQALSLEKNANSPLAKWLPNLRDQYHDWQQVRDRLREGETLVDATFHVIIWADPEFAPTAERKVKDLFRANGWTLKKEQYMQIQSYLTLFPMMSAEGLLEDLRWMGRTHKMTSTNAVSILPIMGEWTGTSTPRMLLPGRRGQMAFWCPFDHGSGNYNMAITASPGKGKSAFTQEYIVAIAGAKGWVWVIDAGRSYEKTCQLLGGQFVDFSLKNQVCINPFSLLCELNEDSLSLLKPLIANMARPLTCASEEELSYIEQAIIETFSQHQNKTTVSDLVIWFKQQNQTICDQLAHLLFSYTRDGIYGRFFEGACSIDFENPFLVLELQELKSKKDLQKIVLQVLMFLVFQKMYLSPRDLIKTCIIDEAWDLFDDDNITTAKFIETGYRTARKFRGNFVSITQSILDYQKNAMSKAAYECSDFKIILGQTDEAVDRATTEKKLDLTPNACEILKSLRMNEHYSECVIKGPDGLSCHRVIFDPYSKMLYSSKGAEFETIRRLMEQGMPCVEAIEQALSDLKDV